MFSVFKGNLFDVYYSMRRFVISLAVCYFVLVFFSPSRIENTSHAEESADLSVFRMFVRFALVWFCLFPLPLGVWKGLWFANVALPGPFSCLFLRSSCIQYNVEFVFWFSQNTANFTDGIQWSSYLHSQH